VGSVAIAWVIGHRSIREWIRGIEGKERGKIRANVMGNVSWPIGIESTARKRRLVTQKKVVSRSWVEPKTVSAGWHCSYSPKKILFGAIVAFLDEIFLGWARPGWVESNRCTHYCNLLCRVNLKKLTFGPIKSGLSPLKDNIKLTNHASVLMDFISILIFFRIIPI
jgi:hypothetical protein